MNYVFDDIIPVTDKSFDVFSMHGVAFGAVKFYTQRIIFFSKSPRAFAHETKFRKPLQP